jgi:glutathione synthase/RimK-type ligase-like ATP-grasp enzyme
MKLKFAGIYRKTEYSPKHDVNDALILAKTAQELKLMGAEVNLYSEGILADNPGKDSIKESLIFSMAQGPIGSAALAEMEESKELIINSGKSVMACYRSNMITMLPKAGIPFPKSEMIKTSINLNGELKLFNSDKIWIKRSDVHAVQRNDVISASKESGEVSSCLNDFKSRGIEKVILQENIAGDVVKFYAVRETGFFNWYYLEKVNQTKFDEKRLMEIAEASAEALGLYVYGGDAVISPDCSITIIDINDWPSFAPVREEASRYIAQLIFRKAENVNKN